MAKAILDRCVRRAIAPLLPAAVIAAVLVAVAATPADAVITHLRNGKAISYMPLRGAASLRFDALLSNLDYNGGPVMPSNTVYPVYWAPAGSPPYPPGYQAGINTYLEDLAHDSGGHQNTDSVAAQYGDSEGHKASYDVKFGEVLLDTHAYPVSGCTRASICLTDAQLQAELSRLVKERGLPTDLTHMYMLLTPPKVEDCFEASGVECSAGTTKPTYCAYHNNARQTDGSQLIYTNDPFVGENPGCDDENHPNGMSDSALQGGLSHEHNEAITDPEPNNAWFDFGGTGGESADKCRVPSNEAKEFGTPLGKAGNGAFYNQEINGHRYWYQQEWSNKGSECLQRQEELTLPTATFTAKAEPGNKLKVDATGSTSGAGVEYNWQFNDEEPFNTPSEPFESPAKTTEHKYPRPCRYTVALTVFAKDGSSTGAAKTVTVGTLIKPEPAIFVLSAKPTAGSAVQFFGEPVEDADGIITKLEWDFGDGSPVVNALAPEHTYGTAGTYEVKLTATDICGESESLTVKLAVAPAAGSEGGGTTPSPAVPAPVLTGKVTLPTTIAARKDGRSKVKLVCTGTAASCSGELVLAVKKTVRVRGHKRTRTIVIGVLRFNIASGRATTVTLKLNAKGRALLRAGHGKLKAQLTLKQTGPTPGKGTAGVRIKLARR